MDFDWACVTVELLSAAVGGGGREGGGTMLLFTVWLLLLLFADDAVVVDDEPFVVVGPDFFRSEERFCPNKGMTRPLDYTLMVNHIDYKLEP